MLRRPALYLVAFVSGCSCARDPIDRTQPNGIEKSFFEGEWYYQQTVVDISGTWSHTFVGESNWQGLERVRFDLQEDWFYVRRSYERIEDAEGRAAAEPGDDQYLGAILAAYPVVSHFDVKRAYNPTTGEEFNVVEENTTDRPWYERQYVRIDWSMNYATNFEFIVDDVEVDPVAHFVQTPDDPDRPVFEDGYFDVTNVLMTKPGMTYFEDIGESYPTCWLLSRQTADCTAEPIEIRSSFLKLDPNHQYVPTPHKGVVTEYFGLFTQDRLVFDPNLEVNERRRERYAQLHNLWTRWLDDWGDPLPAAQREVKPLVYYVHDWPDDLEPTLRAVEGEWDAIFRRTVQATGNPYTGQVLKFCHTPVRAEEDHDLCGETGFTTRLGDIRYNWIAFVPDYYDGFALLGLGPSNADPLTGEVISAGAYLYVYNDVVAQTTAEMVQLLNGDLDPTAYIDGVDLTPWQTAQAQASARTVEPAALSEMAARQDLSWTGGLALGATPEQLATLDGRPVREVVRQLAPGLADAGLFAGDADDSDGRLRSLAGTYLEDLLLTPEMKLAAGIMPGDEAFSDELRRDVSVARVGPFRVMRALEAKRRQWAEVKNVDLMEPVDQGYAGLARRYKGQPIEEVRTGLRDQIYHAVLAHELGHSFDLHHNFGGTEDALNYDDRYWELRAADGTVGPRWQDPMTQAEEDGELYRYAYSSIMDYSRLGLDEGPGKYDAAAILLGYAGKVETFADAHGISTDVFREWAQSDGQVLLFWVTGPEAFHYTEWWNRMGADLYRAENRVLADVADVNWDRGTVRNKVRVPYVFCSPTQSDIGNGCLTRDYGADEYERVSHHIENADTWYVTRSFPRYRVGASLEEYLARTYGRVYGRLKGYNDYYALLTGILSTIYTPEQMQAFLTDGLHGWGAYTIAEHDLVNFLLTTIARPDVGGFEPAVDAAGQDVYRASLFTGAPVNTDVTSGRFFTTAWWSTDYADDCGWTFWECLHHFGFYMDKVMALEALSDANTYFVGRDTAEDVREWRISFYDNYSNVLNDFFGGVLAQDWAGFAPRWTGTDVVFPDYAGAGAPAAGTPLDPATGFTVQLYAAVLGMARFQNNFDKRFLDSTRMWLQGSAFAVASTRGTVSFTDDATGKTYQAIDLPGGVAARMLRRAQAVKARGTAPAELARYVQLLEVMVDLTGYYETFTQGYADPYDPGGVP